MTTRQSNARPGWPTGVRNPDKPSGWLVPPWPPDANLGEIAAHFTRYCARLEPGRIHGPHHVTAAYRGYLDALDAVGDKATELADPARRNWFNDLRASVVACIAASENGLSGKPDPKDRPGRGDGAD